MMSGPYAGEIRIVKPFYARQMIDDGRAIDPNEPIHEPLPSAVDQQPTSKKKGRT